MQLNGSVMCVAGAQVMSVEGDNINMIFLWGKCVYMGTVGANQTSSKVTMNHLFSLNLTDVTINRTSRGLSGDVNQGFEY